MGFTDLFSLTDLQREKLHQDLALPQDTDINEVNKLPTGQPEFPRNFDKGQRSTARLDSPDINEVACVARAKLTERERAIIQAVKEKEFQIDPMYTGGTLYKEVMRLVGLGLITLADIQALGTPLPQRHSGMCRFTEAEFRWAKKHCKENNLNMNRVLRAGFHLYRDNVEQQAMAQEELAKKKSGA